MGGGGGMFTFTKLNTTIISFCLKNSMIGVSNKCTMTFMELYYVKVQRVILFEFIFLHYNELM